MVYIFNTGEFASRLEGARYKANLTQEQLAEMVGISRVSIYKYESGKHRPKHANIKKLAFALNVSEDWLMGNKNDIAPTLLAVAAGLKNIPASYGDSKKIIEKLALDMNYADFEKMWDQFRGEKENRRGWLQVELVKRFPEFIEWMESAPEESPPS